MLVAVILGMSQSVWAAKASYKPFAAAQPDGTTLMVQLKGDERYNWYQTMDGVLLRYHDRSFYVAQTDDDGQLISTGILAHNVEGRGNAELKAVTAQKKDAFFQTISRQETIASRASGFPLPGLCPHMGKVRIPVIMMEYPDHKFSLDKDELYKAFDEFYNGIGRRPFADDVTSIIRGYGSIKQYFLDASNGLFEPEFVFYGPYTADHEMSFYGNSRGLGASDALKKEAISKADADVDFTQFDSDGNRAVDLMYVLYAGNGANIGNHPTSIWPHCSNSLPYKADGMSVPIVGMSNELTDNPFGDDSVFAGIGVFCHEMSHALGLPDLYWATEDPRFYDNCGPEEWDIMDGSENLCCGVWPTQYMAWEKEAMGWITFEQLRDPKYVTVYPLNDALGRGKAYVVKNPAELNEYYVIENYMSSEDSWNYYHWNYNMQLTSDEPGLIITHIDGYPSNPHTMSPNVNHAGKPRITILPADELILGYYNIGTNHIYKGVTTYITFAIYRDDMATDPYPGKNNVTALKHYNNYKMYDMDSRYPIRDIRVNKDRSISFSFRGAIDDGISEITTDCTSDDKVYSLNGQCLGCNLNSLPKGIYIVNGKKVRN